MTNEMQYQRLCAAYSEFIGEGAPKMTPDIMLCLQFVYGNPFPVSTATCSFLKQISKDPELLKEWKDAAISVACHTVLDSLMERPEVSDEDVQTVREILMKSRNATPEEVASAYTAFHNAMDDQLRKPGTKEWYTQRMQNEFFEMYQQVHGSLPTPERVNAYVSKFPPTAEGYVDFQRGLSSDLAFL